MFDVFYWGPKPGLFEFEQPATSLDDAASKSRTTHYWYIYGGNDYTGFNFDYVPVPWQTNFVHTWPSQWQPDGGVYLANKHTRDATHYCTDQSVRRLPNKSLWHIPDNIDDSEFDYSWHPNSAEPDYEYHFPTQWQRDGGPVYPGTAGVKYMNNQKIRAGATQIFYMDFLNGGIARHQFDYLKTQHPTIKRTRYVDNHLNVFKRIMNLATTEYVWIISSICDYTQFDFTWHPEPHQREMIHCFASDGQRRGDTFYIHVPTFTQQMVELELLDWFNVINYCDDQQVERFLDPVHQYTGDNLVEEIKNYQFETPYALFTNMPDITVVNHNCMWTAKDRQVNRLTRSGATVLVPRDIKADLKTQIYDYPYISTSKPRLNDYIDGEYNQLDIVYISNGEPDEQRWYDHACYMSNSEIEWVRGINGRVAAYQEAARRSRTPWFFTVFAKLEVLGNEFDWTWMPDYFQEPKHYIFNARNPLNGLEYGHMGMIAYNKRLVLENNTPGIDFTLSQPHESVPILSGIAHYNQDALMTWRTAFREVIKLKHFMSTQPTTETEHRLNTWLTVATGDFAEWSIRGAKDAVAYYAEVAGDYNKLMLSFEWSWLRDRFNLSKL